MFDNKIIASQYIALLFFLVSIVALLPTYVYAYDLYVGVFSLDERDANGCPIDLYNISTVTVENATGTVCSGQPDTYLAGACQYGDPSNPQYEGAYFLKCSNLTEGNYTVIGSATNYMSVIDTVYLDSNKVVSLMLPKNNTHKLSIYVKDVNNTALQNAKVCVFYTNNTDAYDLYSGSHCLYTSNEGYVQFYLKENNYYITVYATNYNDYKSGTIYLSSDETYNVTLSGSCDPYVVIQCYNNRLVDTEPLNIGVNVKCDVDGPYTIIYYEKNYDTGYTYEEWGVPIGNTYSTYDNNFNVTINPYACGKIEVWLQVSDGNGRELTTNKCYIVNDRDDCTTINETTMPPEMTKPLSGINTTEWEEAGFGWATLFFTPLFWGILITIIISGLSAYAFGGEQKGLVFSIVFLVMIVILTIFRVLPVWTGVIMIIISAGIVAVFVKNMF